MGASIGRAVQVRAAAQAVTDIEKEERFDAVVIEQEFAERDRCSVVLKEDIPIGLSLDRLL